MILIKFQYDNIFTLNGPLKTWEESLHSWGSEIQLATFLGRIEIYFLSTICNLWNAWQPVALSRNGPVAKKSDKQKVIKPLNLVLFDETCLPY